MVSHSFKFDVAMVLKKRGLLKGGRVQKYIDSEVLRLSDPYVPFRKGTAKDSGTLNTVLGSGVVRWKTPYIKTIYYSKTFKFNGEPQRGAFWFKRMKADHGAEIIAGAKKTLKTGDD